jgi:hypothetical protein
LRDVIGILNNREVEAPVLVDASLPTVISLVVFLGVERRGDADSALGI